MLNPLITHEFVQRIHLDRLEKAEKARRINGLEAERSAIKALKQGLGVIMMIAIIIQKRRN